MVSNLVGIPATVLSAYENGHRQPGADVAARIVEALGYRIHFEPALDPVEQGRKLEEALGLAEALPFRPRPMATARL
jgi:transcriptional regulator with XRE-family HTH domain